MGKDIRFALRTGKTLIVNKLVAACVAGAMIILAAACLIGAMIRLIAASLAGAIDIVRL